jgi:hypothetical protein
MYARSGPTEEGEDRYHRGPPFSETKLSQPITGAPERTGEALRFVAKICSIIMDGM